MSITRLISELEQVPSLIDNFKKFYDANQSVPVITNERDINLLLDTLSSIANESCLYDLTVVNIPICKIHITVAKPYLDNLHLEDDFI